MTDKERILMCIITRIIPALIVPALPENGEYVEYAFSDPNRQIVSGDLVFGYTTTAPNDFLVGFVDRVENDFVVIREIGSERRCTYHNENFFKINKERLGYEVLEGNEYKLYQKTVKAFSKYTKHSTEFKSISFSGRKCTVEARHAFSKDTFFKTSFRFNSITSVKKIGKILSVAETNSEGKRDKAQPPQEG